MTLVITFVGYLRRKDEKEKRTWAYTIYLIARGRHSSMSLSGTEFHTKIDW